MRRTTRRGRGRGLTRDERGVAMVITTLTLALLVGMAALAIDVGFVLAARSEAQRAADAAALAGAGSLILTPGDDGLARSRAVQFAGLNVVHEAPVVLGPGDVDVDLDELKVTVRVHRTEERGNPIPTIFARVLNIDAVDVSTRAVAKAEPAGRASCVLPVAMPDRWTEVDGEPGYDPDGGDFYVPCPGGDCTGYLFPRDYGAPVQLKPAQGGDDADGGGSFESGWWYLWEPGEQGASQLKDFVSGCPDPSATWGTGEPLTDKNGNHQSIIREFERLIDSDPGASYEAECGCIVGSAFDTSPRLRSVALFDPDSYVKVGSGSNFVISNFVGVFVDRVDTGPQGRKGVWVILVPAVGSGEGESGGGGQFLRFPLLVE